jgi:hypothetical protein
VREFWINLVPFYEEWQQNRALLGQVPDLKQQAMELNQRCAALELAAENQEKQTQQIAENMQDKQREIVHLQRTLREVNERNTEERERHRVLLARHRASVRPTSSQLVRGPHPSGNRFRKPNIVLRSNN